MGPRPTHLNLGDERREAFEPPRLPFRTDLPSPRAGEVPPALSPLDAFAMHSRLLAKKFDDEQRTSGRRISRLPPVVVAQEMSNRPGYFRQLSQNAAASTAANGEGSSSGMVNVPEALEETSPLSARPFTVDEADEKNRPKSLYPIMGLARPGSELRPGSEVPDLPTAKASDATNVLPPYQPPQQDYFGFSVPRAASPEAVDTSSGGVGVPHSPTTVPSLSGTGSSLDTIASQPARAATNDSQRSQLSARGEGLGLAPPLSPRYPRSPRSFQSIRSVPPDDEEAVSGSTVMPNPLSQHPPSIASRKFSSGSGSRPQSPFSPWQQPVHRSPSMASDYSMGGSGMQSHQSNSNSPLPPPFRPTANFSRPMSSSSNIAPIGARRSFDTRPSMEGARPSLDMRPHPLSGNPNTNNHPHGHYPSPSMASVASSMRSGAGTPSLYSAVSRQNSGDDTQIPAAEDTFYPARESNDGRSTPMQQFLPRPSDATVPDAAFDASGASAPSSKQDPQQPASYIYAKYALPRGRPMERTSNGGIRASWIHRQFTWDKPESGTEAPGKTAAPVTEEPTSAPPTQVLHDSLAGFSSVPIRGRSPPLDERPGRTLASANSAVRSRSADPRTLDRGRVASPTSPTPWRGVASPLMQSTSASASTNALPQTAQSSSSAYSTPAIGSGSAHRSTASVHTSSTDRTIRPETSGTATATLHARSLSADLTPEQHLDIGIAAHSAGETTKSTYHLRLAAHAGLPTAMLLYALACRHGWGMRVQPEEGVRWLRKAVAVTTGGLDDLAAAEARLLDAAATANDSATARKERRAQYALAIYELGVSSLRGWGCPKDKPLALRCFEIAGAWGDADALAEAGYCYAQGVGCKKDLKKAAGLYRAAEKRGMSMAGNSWIYKPKYMDPADSDASHPAAAAATSRPSTNAKRPDTAVSAKTTASGTSASTAFPSVDGTGLPATTTTTANSNPTGGRARSRSLWGRRKDKDRGVPDLAGVLPLPAPPPGGAGTPMTG